MKIKLTFFNETVRFDGDITTMTVGFYSRIIFNSGFKCSSSPGYVTAKVTRKPEDKNDINFAIQLLRAKCEIKAYKEAYKSFTKEITEYSDIINAMKDFQVKSENIIKHNTEYINKLCHETKS